MYFLLGIYFNSPFKKSLKIVAAILLNSQSRQDFTCRYPTDLVNSLLPLQRAQELPQCRLGVERARAWAPLWARAPAQRSCKVQLPPGCGLEHLPELSPGLGWKRQTSGARFTSRTHETKMSRAVCCAVPREQGPVLQIKEKRWS